VTLAQALSAYFALNAAVAIGFIGLVLVEVFARRLPARQRLALNYGACAALVVSVCVSALLPDVAFFEPAVRVWTDLAQDGGVDVTRAWITLGAGTTFDAGSAGRVWIATALVLLAFGSALLLRDFFRLRAIRRHSYCVRRIGCVRVWISDVIATPFSYWRPGRAHVVLPAWLVERPEQFRMVLAHELQHHRQRDTVWLHAFRALRLMCVANPFAHLWARHVARIQEFACDEALTARPAFAAYDYARCLVAVALRGTDFKAPANAAGLIGFGDPKALIRRIEKMMQPQPARRTGNNRLLVACLAITMTAAAFAAGGWIEDQTQETAVAPAQAEASVWPVRGGEVTAEFGKHRGIDIAVDEGTAVVAFRAGVVETVDETKGCGKRVRIRHSDVVSIYCNLASVQVTVGEEVAMGAEVARIGSPWPGRRPHLHFEVQSVEKHVDPRTQLPRLAAPTGEMSRGAIALRQRLGFRLYKDPASGDKC